MSGLDRSAVVGIVGAGVMGGGIAEVAARAGHPVRLFDAVPEAPRQAIDAIAGRLARAVEKGRLSGEQSNAMMARIVAAADLADLGPSALVVEAAAESLGVKRELFAALEQACAAEAILATNTSSLAIEAIAAELRHPERVVGMHFFNPAPLMGLVEVVSGLATRPGVAATVFETASAWGKVPVHVRSTPGFIVNRVARPFYGEALAVLAERGADAPTIDAILREAGGFRMGALELTDLIGQDINAAVSASIYEAFHQDPRYRPSLVQKALVDAGRLGRKSGQGVYDYRPDAVRPRAADAPPGMHPDCVRVSGDLGWAEPLVPMIASAGVRVERDPAGGHSDRHVSLPAGGQLRATDGALATQHAARLGEPVVLFDLMREPLTAGRVAMAASDGCPDDVLAEAVGLVQVLGKRVSVIDDVPGLVLMRTLAMLANEACDVVHQGIAEADAVDTAMMNGTNYPEGPLAWADRLGAATVLQVLENLASAYGDGRYRPSLRLRRRVLAGQPLR